MNRYYKVMGAQTDKHGTVVLSDDAITIGAVYHPQTMQLNIVILQEYTEWAQDNPQEYQKELQERAREGALLPTLEQMEQAEDNEELAHKGESLNEPSDDKPASDEDNVDSGEGSGEHTADGLEDK